VDEHRIEVVVARAPGWVEELAVRASGDPVRRGQRLAAVYSPDLLAAQQEFLIVRATASADLVAAGRQRLVLLGLSEGQIARVEQSGRAERDVTYYAPFDGYVMDLGVRQGMAVERDTTLFQLADLSSVWVNAEVPETQAAWIKTGDRVEAEITALPGERFQGTIDYIYPELMAATRTLKVRVVLTNPGLALATGDVRGDAPARHPQGTGDPDSHGSGHQDRCTQRGHRCGRCEPLPPRLGAGGSRNTAASPRSSMASCRANRSSPPDSF
jgi:Cu(I)/Ag(I) efflux system membrane fusion protein